MSTLAYRADIDGIRAIAVLLVLVFHFHLVPGQSSGFVGVDVFFVISGFLITTIVNRQTQGGTFQLRLFWIQRIRRLAPALFATSAATLLMGWFWLFPLDFEKLATQMVASQLYVSNIFYWRSVNYFGLQAHDVYLLHTWSLAVEEQFYLAFPVAFLVAFRFFPDRLGAILLSLAMVSFALNLTFVVAKPEATFYLMPTRAWELLAGSLLALFVHVRHVRAPLANALGACGAVCLALAVGAYRVDRPFPGAFALLPVAAGVLLILSGSYGPSVSSRVLGVAPLVYIGKISYPLYLVHWPIDVFAASVMGAGYGWNWRAAMFLLSLISASAIYYFVERPLRRWLELEAPRLTLWIYGAALAVVVATSVALLGTHGAPARFSDRAVALASYASDTPPPLSQCEFHGQDLTNPRTQLCRLGLQGAEPRWFVYGDSHAWAGSGAIDRWLAKNGQAAIFMFVHACPPIRGVYVFRQASTCFDFNEAVLGYLAGHPSISEVFLVSTWHQPKEAILTGALGLKLSEKESLRLFALQFSSTLRELHAIGKNVYVWEPLPGARSRVPIAMARAEQGWATSALDFSRSEYLDEYRFFFEGLHGARGLVKATFSPSRELCDSGRCLTQRGGIPLYSDNAHLTYSQSTFWADALERQLPIGDEARLR